MKHAMRLIGCLACALCIGCGSGNRIIPPAAELNPGANDLQLFTISVTGRVDQIASIQGSLQYNIADTSCVPVDYGVALGGTKPRFSTYSPLKMTAMGSGKYEFSVYRDLYRPANYYGLGVCVWALTSINIKILRIDGKKETASLIGRELGYDVHVLAACGPRVSGFGCSYGDFAASANADYKLSISSRKE